MPKRKGNKERKPLSRNKGKYAHELEGMDEYAEKVAKELCAMYPNVDILDIDYIFAKSFGFAMSMAHLRENEEKL